MSVPIVMNDGDLAGLVRDAVARAVAQSPMGERTKVHITGVLYDRSILDGEVSVRVSLILRPDFSKVSS